MVKIMGGGANIIGFGSNQSLNTELDSIHGTPVKVGNGNGNGGSGTGKFGYFRDRDRERDEGRTPPARE